MKTKVEQLSGISIHLFRDSSPAFFTPFNSNSERAYATAAIVSAPLIFTLGTAFFALNALFHFYEAISNLVSFNFSESKQDIIAAKDDFLLAVKSCLFIVLSPCVNTVNCIGRAINSSQESVAESENDALIHP